MEGEWFEDENGNKVRMMKNKNGEEVYEVMEGKNKIQFKHFFYYH